MTWLRFPAVSAQNASLVGITLMTICVFLFAMNNVFGKWLIMAVPIGEFMLLRSVMILTVISPFIWRFGRDGIAALPNKPLHVFRMAIASIEVAMFYFTLSLLPLADTLTFWMAVPIYVTVMSAIFLGERIEWRRWVAVAVGFGGVLLIMRPSAATISWPALVGLVGSVFYGGVLVMTRALRSAPDSILMGGQFLGAMIFGLASLPFGFVMPTLNDLALVCVLVTFSIIGNLCANQSLRVAPASVVTPYKYTTIIWGILFGYMFFNEVPGPMTILGAAIVIAAGFYILLREQAAARQARAAVVPQPADLT